MKKLLLFTVAITALIFTINSYGAWLTNYEQALSKAKRENKVILADVSGQNWCIWCKRLDQEVFDTQEFKSFAKKNLVLLLIDVPKPSALSSEAKKFMEKYPVNGYPTVYILNENGKVLHKTGYQRGGPQNYIKSLMPFIKVPAVSTNKQVVTQNAPTPRKTGNNENISKESEQKIAEINNIIKTYTEKGEDIEDSFIQENILQEVNKKYPIDNEFKLNKINEVEVSELAATLTDKKYPKELKHLKEEYQKVAEEKYHIAKPKEDVTVKFKLGSSVFTATGPFNGYTMSGNGVVVGRHKIAFFDLLPESKCLFSSKLCQEMQNEYIKQQISLYLNKKNFFSEQQKTLARSMLQKANENAGYILYNSEWLKPDKITEILINDNLDKIDKSDDSGNKEYEEDYEVTFESDNNNTVSQQEIEQIMQSFNPLIFVPIVLLMSLFGICSFICLIISLVRMFQNGKTAIAIICIILSLFSGIGPFIAFIYSWVKVKEFGTGKLMKFWTICFVLNIILMIVLFWQFFSVIFPLITNYRQ